ncbi:lysophospholipid acyltransferase family protein [Chachezhania antarctica]|uniref:lysophospholipid acyltransferase family protein n=1 Tax=Chachezhania antarctica TaxID=2340860 RepID=UPI000EAD3320|nr:DUF374 domain-containing protein [Chachezhania antarctica]|tara:strand:- start:1278 stop:1979 length:702 start_codon:yes stop_codon:yes gene_type:complete
MSLRKKIANSETLNNAVESMIVRYMKFAYRTSSWKRIGYEEMDKAGENGEPIIAGLWHQRLMMGPWLCDLSRHRMCTLTTDARAGRMAGNVQLRLGMENIKMSSHKRHIALSREVLARMNDGCSIGIACDGPRGPARISSNVPLVWARTSGARIFLVAFSAKRVWALPTWDRMFMPCPFTRGVFISREWDQKVPRRASAEEFEALRVKFQEDLDALTAEADRLAGRKLVEFQT